MKRPILLPLVPLYAAASRLRWFGNTPLQLTWPVISVGNLSTGGTGKTPFVIALARLLSERGIYADVLSRGYGRQISTPARVIPDGDPAFFGDEPLQIACETGVPVYVAAQRHQAGVLAEQVARKAGIATGMHLLDDGFQHRQLARQADIVLVNSDDLNDHLLPAGNLRETIAALRRATLFAVPERDSACMYKLRNLQLSQPVIRFSRQMTVPDHLLAPTSPPVLAFCGIARPNQFFSGLKDQGVRLVAQHAFRDHHRFTLADVKFLSRLHQESGAHGLVTTRKDLVRLGSLHSHFEAINSLFIADLKIRIEDTQGSLSDLLRSLHLSP